MVQSKCILSVLLLSSTVPGIENSKLMCNMCLLTCQGIIMYCSYSECDWAQPFYSSTSFLKRHIISIVNVLITLFCEKKKKTPYKTWSCLETLTEPDRNIDIVS